jgi:hypothetical protein
LVGDRATAPTWVTAKKAMLDFLQITHTADHMEAFKREHEVELQLVASKTTAMTPRTPGAREWVPLASKRSPATDTRPPTDDNSDLMSSTNSGKVEAVGCRGVTGPTWSCRGATGDCGPTGEALGWDGPTGSNGGPTGSEETACGARGATGPSGSCYGPTGHTGSEETAYGARGATGPSGSCYGPTGHTGSEETAYGARGATGSSGSCYGPTGRTESVEAVGCCGQTACSGLTTRLPAQHSDTVLSAPYAGAGAPPA